MLWKKYVFHKQTIRELVESEKLDKKTIHSYLQEYVVPQKVHSPRKVMVVCDATYFGKRKSGNSWGVLVFRDVLQKENLWWKYIDHEKKIDYLEGKIYLESLGYTFAGVTAPHPSLENTLLVN